MKVLHLVHSFPPEITGGTEQYLAGLVRRQNAAGIQVEVCCGSEERREENFRQSEDWHGVSVTRFFRREKEKFGVLYRPERLLKELIQHIQVRSPDLLHLHHWFNLNDQLLSHLPDIPALATFHDSYAACPRFFLLRPDGGFCGNELPVPLQRCVDCCGLDDGEEHLEERLVERRSGFAKEIGRLSLAFAPSRFHGEILVQSRLIPRSLLRVLPLGIEPGLAKAPHRAVSSPLRLGTFGNLSKIKGVDMLLQAVRGLSSPDAVEVHLYGTPVEKDREDLRRSAEGLAVHFHGRYDRCALAAAAEKLDLAVFPSRAYETYSLVLEEAIALGLPVIVSNRGALPERVGDFGEIIGVEDEIELRDTLERLLRHPQRLAAMRKKVPATYQTLDIHEQRLRGYYHEILGPQNKTRSTRE